MCWKVLWVSLPSAVALSGLGKRLSLVWLCYLSAPLPTSTTLQGTAEHCPDCWISKENLEREQEKIAAPDVQRGNPVTRGGLSPEWEQDPETRHWQVKWEVGPCNMALDKNWGAQSLQQGPHPPDQLSRHTDGVHLARIFQGKSCKAVVLWKWGKVSHGGHDCIVYWVLCVI